MQKLLNIRIIALISAATLWASGAHSAKLGLNEDGIMTVAANAIFPPIVSIDPNGQYVGFDVDIMEAVAKELDVKINWVSIKFDGIIPGIASKRFDVGVTGVTDTVERQQAVDFVNYATVGSGIMVQAGNPKNIHSLSDLCGKIVASQTGDLATTLAKAQSKKCAGAGNLEVTVKEFPEDTQSLLQLKSGRADVVMHDYPISAYTAQKSEGKLELVGEQFLPAPYGMVIQKNNVEIREALMRGLDAIIASGEYQKILDKYGLGEIGITKATFNIASQKKN